MAEPRLGYWDYVKAAFNLKTRFPLLGDMPLNKLLLAGVVILGFGNPGFWLLGVGAEAAYLLWLSGNPRFQALVRGERLAREQLSWEEHEGELLARLDEAARERYRRLVSRCKSIMQIQTADGLGGMGTEDLHQVRPIFLRLLNVRARIQQLLKTTRREDLEADISKLRDRLKQAPADSAVARSLEETLKIQQARLENLDRSAASLQYVHTELERIENQLSLIAEEITVSRSPEQWSRSIDGVMQTIQGTSQWMAAHSDLLESTDMPAPVVIAGGGKIAQKQ